MASWEDRAESVRREWQVLCARYKQDLKEVSERYNFRFEGNVNLDFDLIDKNGRHVMNIRIE